jgi:hypothetical protein
MIHLITIAIIITILSLSFIINKFINDYILSVGFIISSVFIYYVLYCLVKILL